MVKPKIGRNDSCPCGSGRKFKRCCIDSERPAPPATRAVAQAQAKAHIDGPAAPIDEADALDDARGRAMDLGVGVNVGIGVDDRTRGALAEAESSLLVHLELYERLGNKEGAATAYAELGSLYRTLGDLAPAEAMYREALKLDEALGRKECMAAACGHLGRLYEARGDRVQAAAMRRQSLALLPQAEPAPQARQLQDWLDKLTVLRGT